MYGSKVYTIQEARIVAADFNHDERDMVSDPADRCRYVVDVVNPDENTANIKVIEPSGEVYYL